MFHFGTTELYTISGCISLTQQLFIVHYLCLANFESQFLPKRMHFQELGFISNSVI